MNFFDNVSLAMESVRSNWLRAILTLVIIAFGIMALVGILTAIDTAIYSLNDNLSSQGSGYPKSFQYYLTISENPSNAVST